MPTPTDTVRDRLIARQTELEAELVLVNELLDVFKKNGTGGTTTRTKSSGNHEVSPGLKERVWKHVQAKDEAEPGVLIRPRDVAKELGISQGSASKALVVLSREADAKIEVGADRVAGERGIVTQYQIKKTQPESNTTLVEPPAA